MDEFKIRVLMEDDFDGFMPKTHPTITFIPKLIKPKIAQISNIQV